MLRKNAYDLFLSLDDVEKIHESTLRVLKEVGVEFKHEEVLDVFKKHGARVENSIVYLDEDIINNALQTVPKSFELHGRAGFSTISVDGAPVITTAGGPPQLVHEDDSIRDSTLEDVIKFYKLIESSDVIDVTRIVSSDTSDLDRNSENLFNPQQALLLKYNTKPVYGTIVNSNHTRGKSIRQGTRDSIQLIKKFYDVWDKNIILTDHCCISPLSVGSEVLENMLAMLDEDQIVQFTVCSMTNLTSPPSIMGTVVQDNATLLAAMVFTQLVKPGTPTIYRTLSAPTDMREVKLAIGSPENTLLGFAGIAMARYYGVPVGSGGGLSDSLTVDYQAGAETMMTLLPTYLGNADFVSHSVGTLGSFNLGSFEKLVLDEEVVSMLKRLYEGIAISDKKDGVDLMLKVGPRGNYLKGRTPKDYREEHYLPKYFNKQGDKLADREKFGTALDRAKKEVQRRVDEYELPETTKKQKEILNEYLPDPYKYDL